MTTLRSDGYLETDNAVVAACFIGKQVTAQGDDGPVSGALAELGVDGGRLYAELMVPDDESETGASFWAVGDPDNGGISILIPASVVGEVWSQNESAHKVLNVLCGEMELSRFIINNTHYDTQGGIE